MGEPDSNDLPEVDARADRPGDTLAQPDRPADADSSEDGEIPDLVTEERLSDSDADGLVDGDAVIDAEADCARQPHPVAPDLSSARINGQRMLYSSSASERGVLFFFHGNGGSADIWVDRAEHVLLTNMAIERGLLVAALDSVGTGWDKRCCGAAQSCCSDDLCCSDEGADIQNVRDAIRYLVSEGLIVEDASIYALGYSNGGGFTGRLTQGVDLTAAATVNSSSSPNIINRAESPPMFFQGASQDPIVSADLALGNYEAFSERGVRTAFRLNTPAPLTPGRFSRIQGIDCDESIRLVTWLTDEELVAEDGTLLANAGTIIDRMEAAPFWTNNGFDRHTKNIKLQIQELDAQHALSSEWAVDIFDFLLWAAE